ncbi:hypothetical protein LWC35_23350 [Pseudonocardia kujensis]|uniref:hypothetical protein n=1 Tax=Pseudonocardia kujensis TaxID=1128675 RepID=UPI001E50053F|nr:hypothetical protein [Pseudonocardia kujensis]MCE0765820.1 hypothetical protein [Pseudonocardia kujensis]
MKRLLVASLLTLGLIAAVAACGSSSFALRGAVSIDINGRSVIGGPEMCSGFFGYGDITEGAAVTVYDSSGKIIATGKLQKGTAPDRQVCRLPFEVANVPGGEDFYQIEVAQRGRATFSAEEAKSGNINMGAG